MNYNKKLSEYGFKRGSIRKLERSRMIDPDFIYRKKGEEIYIYCLYRSHYVEHYKDGIGREAKSFTGVEDAVDSLISSAKD